LKVALEGEILDSSTGDVIFITAGADFNYWNEVVFTKVLHVAGGFNGLDTQLIDGGVAWNFPVWPVN